MTEPSSTSTSKSLTIRLNFKWLSLILFIIILTMIAMWRPWARVNTGRKINVSGEVTIKAEPDEYVFSPLYQKKGNDSNKSLAELSAMQKTVVDKLKELGVADEDIKANTSSYDQPIYTAEGNGKSEIVTSLYVTAVVHTKDLAQKVQDYLLTTTPQGQISPNAQFSESKRKELEQEARVKATEDAKDKARRQAENLGTKLGKVIEVTDGAGFDIIRPMTMMATDVYSVPKSGASIQPGQNDFTFTVNITYALK